jgi:hypothetical protein
VGTNNKSVVHVAFDKLVGSVKMKNLNKITASNEIYLAVVGTRLEFKIHASEQLAFNLV